MDFLTLEFDDEFIATYYFILAANGLDPLDVPSAYDGLVSGGVGHLWSVASPLQWASDTYGNGVNFSFLLGAALGAETDLITDSNVVGASGRSDNPGGTVYLVEPGRLIVVDYSGILGTLHLEGQID